VVWWKATKKVNFDLEEVGFSRVVFGQQPKRFVAKNEGKYGAAVKWVSEYGHIFRQKKKLKTYK